mgnify:CR=1 FL=1
MRRPVSARARPTGPRPDPVGSRIYGVGLIDSIRYWHTWDTGRGALQAFALKRVGQFYWDDPDESVPDLYSECLLDAHPGYVDTKWDGAKIGEAANWAMNHPDWELLKQLGFPPESWNRYLKARLMGKCGGIEANANNPVIYAQSFRL